VVEMKSVYPIASGTSLHWKSAGEATFAALLAGARSCGFALLHDAVMVIVRLLEARSGQSSLSAAAHHWYVPAERSSTTTELTRVVSMRRGMPPARCTKRP
jgi:hypothetical protein